MTRTRLYFLGYSKGFNLAISYATGTRADRRAIRGRLGRLAESYSQFAMGLHEGFSDAATQRAEHILAGRAKRTVNPHRLANLLSRMG